MNVPFVMHHSGFSITVILTLGTTHIDSGIPQVSLWERVEQFSHQQKPRKPKVYPGLQGTHNRNPMVQKSLQPSPWKAQLHPHCSRTMKEGTRSREARDILIIDLLFIARTSGILTYTRAKNHVASCASCI